MKSERIVSWLRDKAARAEGLDYRRMLTVAADKLMELEKELREEMHRHDRLQDFEVAEAEELARLRETAGGNRVPYWKRAETYVNALIHFGENKQMVVAIEELSECQKELCKFFRGMGDLEHLAEEIADATIMLEQMRMIFGLNDMVCRIMDEKVKRLDRKLKGTG